jgi:hypothetical protein
VIACTPPDFCRRSAVQERIAWAGGVGGAKQLSRHFTWPFKVTCSIPVPMEDGVYWFLPRSWHVRKLVFYPTPRQGGVSRCHVYSPNRLVLRPTHTYWRMGYTVLASLWSRDSATTEVLLIFALFYQYRQVAILIRVKMFSFVVCLPKLRHFYFLKYFCCIFQTPFINVTKYEMKFRKNSDKFRPHKSRDYHVKA